MSDLDRIVQSFRRHGSIAKFQADLYNWMQTANPVDVVTMAQFIRDGLERT